MLSENTLKNLFVLVIENTTIEILKKKEDLYHLVFLVEM